MHKRLESLDIKENIEFPGKLYFSCFSPSALTKRMHKLEVYLNQLVQLFNLLDCSFALEFLEIDSRSKDLLISLQDNTESSSLLHFDPDQCIEQFLQLLELKPVIISSAVKTFESLYFDNKFRFTKQEIEQFLWGNQKRKGLLVYCGDHNNHIGANSCLALFIKLLKYEYNSLEAERFLDVYTNTNPLMVKKMDLGWHIRQGGKDNEGCLAVYYYLSGNIYNLRRADELLSDEVTISKYENWVKLKQLNRYLPMVPIKKFITKATRSDSKASNDTEESDYNQTVTEKVPELEQTKMHKEQLFKVA